GTESVVVFVTSSESSAYRIDDFDGLDEASVRLPLPSQHPFTHASQESLLSRIAPNSAATDANAIPLSQLSESLSQSQISQGVNRLSQASQSQATASHKAESSDSHLLVHRDRVESYSGLITRVVDATLGIYLVDDCHVLMLTFWPLLSLLSALRPGTRVLLDNMHVLLLTNSKSYHWSWLKRIWPLSRAQPIATDELRALVFGACARSSLRIVEFPHTDQPSLVHSLLAESVATHVVKQAGGLVRMIEAVEAYWKLQVKFPDGLSVSPLHSTTTTNGSTDEIMDLALELTGRCRPSMAANPSGYRRLYIEFLNHARCTSVDCMNRQPASRVVALGDVVQRFLSRKSERRNSEAALNAQAHSESTHRASRTEEVQVINTYPAELSLGTFPLIGRLVLRQRGVLYLQDATGWLQIRPTTVPISSDDDADTPRLEFTGQALVGHVYLWRQWWLTSESINIASVGNSLSVPLECSKASSEATVEPFELVYVAAANPTIIYADRSFGHANVSDLAKGAETRAIQCFLLVVHTQSPVTVAPHRKKNKFGVGDGGKHGAVVWGSYIAVKGTGLKIDYSELHSYLGQGTQDSAFCASVSESDELLNCVLSYDPDKFPVSFMPGSAYVVCVNDPSTITRFSQSSTDIQIALKSACHIHPVWITATDCSDAGGKPYTAMHHRELLRQASSGSRSLHIPTIQVDSANSAILDAIRPPPVYPVRELRSLMASALQTVSETAESSRPGDIVSVYGTIDKRGIKQVVSFASSGRVEGVRQGIKRAKPHSGSVEPRALCFDTRIVLRDNRDSSSTITLYAELSSLAHPLGLVPGACMVVRDVRLEVAKGSGRTYLRSVAATSFQEISTGLANLAPVAKSSQAAEHVETESVCIGQLYSRQFKKVAFNCSVCAIEQLRLSIACKKCKQTVCAFLCACAGLHHRLTSKPEATAVVTIELRCRVADGSGTARLLVYDEAALAEILALSDTHVSELFTTAAQS
ncbi:hypothetical protein GGI21_002638, partial [Coemansia aciculifera]